MPLLDHFNPPLNRTHPWRSFHAAWAAAMARLLNQGSLPVGYNAAPLVDRTNSIEIDMATRRVTRGGVAVDLTAKEFDLLAHLAAHPGRVYTREHLLRAVWGYDYFGDDSTVTVHVRRLREKLEPDPARPRYVTTVWGVGYRFEA